MIKKHDGMTLFLAGFVLALFSIGLQTARAQDSFPASPPSDLPARSLTLPKTESHTLPNGLKIVVAESHRVPLVTMQLAVRAGSVLDPPEVPGLASAVANQMSAGTDKYSSYELRVAAEKLGGSVGVGASQDYATVSASGLAENLGPLADLMADVLLHPTFPDSELKTYKQLTMQGLILQRQSPDFLAREELNKVLYGTHPYSVTSATPASIQSLTPEKLKGFYGDYYVPNDAILIVVGDVKAANVFSVLEKPLGGWKGHETHINEAATPPFPTQTGRRIYLVPRPGSVQSNILFGNVMFKRNDPDFFPLLVANNILGGGSGSRLFANVREKQGYAYDVRSSAGYNIQTGTFTESAQTRTAVTAPALKLMLQETDSIRTQPVSEQELKDTKGYLTGVFALQLTSQAGLAGSLLTVELYHLPPDYLATLRDKINAVTTADIQRASQRAMLSDKAVIVVVGDADQLRDSLKEIGEVEEIK